jgi:hypothetical protein
MIVCRKQQNEKPDHHGRFKKNNQEISRARDPVRGADRVDSADRRWIISNSSFDRFSQALDRDHLHGRIFGLLGMGAPGQAKTTGSLIQLQSIAAMRVLGRSTAARHLWFGDAD